jgi:hypothetical protein
MTSPAATCLKEGCTLFGPPIQLGYCSQHFSEFKQHATPEQLAYLQGATTKRDRKIAYQKGFLNASMLGVSPLQEFIQSNPFQAEDDEIDILEGALGEAMETAINCNKLDVCKFIVEKFGNKVGKVSCFACDSANTTKRN